MNLKELREKHKLSQAALGSALGVSGEDFAHEKITIKASAFIVKPAKQSKIERRRNR